MRNLLILGGIVYALIYLRNWAQKTPQLQEGDILIQIPPIPLKSQGVGNKNMLRIIFGSDIRYNKNRGCWELVLPPIVINRRQLAQLPDVIKEFILG